ncbi:hypothetical protein LOAG_03523 [Loa loa]|uniref:Tudor domain-containing protein n=1 Tax=Loa loa TaxID=7209 RepID=A0A1I7VT84_LOALO|nr:hypothetical protein LOAG_03523 [Loa loa]EFO24966.2 hypothetical protein LOAG_03523 [Loa loa]
MNVAEKLQLSKASFELKGVIVKLENNWLTISIVSPAVEVNSFEIELENDALSEVLQLGSWVILYNAGQNVYQIARQCNEVLPTYVYKDLVLLKTNIRFQGKKQEGYGSWVWSLELGRVAAVCHERYKPKQDYVALVARKPTKYRLTVEYNWMLTKYIEERSLNVQLDAIFQKHRICNSRENRFNKEHEVHRSDSGDYCSDNTEDDDHLFYENLEENKHRNSTSNNIYAVITKVVSNPNIRVAMQRYRPKELLSICEALNLKFSISDPSS